MREIKWTPSKKQKKAFDYLTDTETTELFYGGGAGGGKSYLGCAWLVYMCLRYPGTRYLMGRAVLKSLKQSTLLSFFMVCREWGLKKDEDYKFNAMEGTIKFNNGSEIFLKDLYLYPSDPEFDSLGSTEYTGAFIDEVSQITEKAKNIVMSRLRFRISEYNLVPKLLMASNPSKNFAYRDYYLPYKEKTLPKFRKFLPALVTDNPFIDKNYIENLKKLDKNSRERLLNGNWEYDDDPSRLFDYEDLVKIFKQQSNEGEYYISVDVARFGPDKTIIILWRGFCIKKIWSFNKQSTKETRIKIQRVIDSYEVPLYNVIIDEDGIGGGIVDEMVYVKGFVNNSSPLEKKQTSSKAYTNPKEHNFANLKSQCYFMLADYIRRGFISCYDGIDITTKKGIIEDLEQIKWHNPDKDERVRVTPKEEIKENLGRSPDYGDALMMRMYFELKSSKGGYIAV